MALISYNDFIANAQEADINALAILAAGTQVKTTNASEADGYQAQCQRLYDAGLLTRFARGLEMTSDGVSWHTFDGRLAPEAVPYIAQAAKERVLLSRNPIP